MGSSINPRHTMPAYSQSGRAIEQGLLGPRDRVTRSGAFVASMFFCTKRDH